MLEMFWQTATCGCLLGVQLWRGAGRLVESLQPARILFSTRAIVVSEVGGCCQNHDGPVSRISLGLLPWGISGQAL